MLLAAVGLVALQVLLCEDQRRLRVFIPLSWLCDLMLDLLDLKRSFVAREHRLVKRGRCLYTLVIQPHHRFRRLYSLRCAERLLCALATREQKQTPCTKYAQESFDGSVCAVSYLSFTQCFTHVWGLLMWVMDTHFRCCCRWIIADFCEMWTRCC